MLTIVVSAQEYFDESKKEFVSVPDTTVQLEHSLVSLSKWEAIHEKPFLSKDEKTDSEILSYIECMVLSPEVSPTIVRFFSADDYARIQSYLDAKMTATWFSTRKEGPSREIVTAEVIYYWMFSFGVPLECQEWHLNRLLTLLKVCNAKNQPQKKMSKSELAARNRRLNEQRRAALGTRG